MRRFVLVAIATSTLLGTLFCFSQGQPGLPKPGSYYSGQCPPEIGCTAGENAVVVEQLVDHGDYVKEEDPACNRDVKEGLKQGARDAADAKTNGNATRYAGPLVDEATKQLAGALSGMQQGGTIGSLITSMTGAQANCRVLCAVLPKGAQVTGTAFFMGDGTNGAFACNPDSTGQLPCPPGWAKWVPMEPVTGSERVIACNEFRNWSDSRGRWASMAVKHK